MSSIVSTLQAKKESSTQNTKIQRLNALKSHLVAGIFDEKERKKKEEKLRFLLKNSLFLREDEQRRKRWIDSIESIPLKLIDRLIPAITREDLRYKQKKRNLIIELNKKYAGE